MLMFFLFFFLHIYTVSVDDTSHSLQYYSRAYLLLSHTEMPEYFLIFSNFSFFPRIFTLVSTVVQHNNFSILCDMLLINTYTS